MTQSKDKIRADFKSRLQVVYGEMQKSLGIEYGDISLFELIALEDAEDVLANIVSEWLYEEVDHE